MQFYGNEKLFGQLNATNLIPGMQRGNMFGPGRYIDTKDHKWHKFPGVAIDVSWIYVNPNPDLYCMTYHSIVDGYGFIPTKCLDCYKIVVMPRTFTELMQLLKLQQALIKSNPKCWCKCGTEHRDFVSRNYGGYFYTRGLEQGRIRYKTVRHGVSENISPDVPVILKRYCTEFELQFGPSDQYRQPVGADEIEQMFFENVQLSQEAVPQPEFVQKHIIHQWMMFAWGRGDKTVMNYNEGKPLYPHYVTYHDKPKEG
jgi:hypothetical protein